MPSTTPVHGLPVPSGGDSVDVVRDVANLGNAVDGLLPVVSASAPSSPSAGLVWFNSTSGVGQWWDGTAWRLLQPSYNYSGTPVAGAVFNANAPVVTKVFRVNATTDTNGLISVGLPTMTTLLDASAHVDVFSNTWRSAVLRTDLSTTSAVVFQIHDGMSGGAALVSTAGVVTTVRVEYQ